MAVELNIYAVTYVDRKKPGWLYKYALNRLLLFKYWNFLLDATARLSSRLIEFSAYGR
jgi:hypothetical protein